GGLGGGGGGGEEGVGGGGGAGRGRQQNPVPALGIVQRVVEPRHDARGVAESLVLGDVLDALAVDVDLASVRQRGQILGTGLRRRDLELSRRFRLCRKGCARVGARNGHRFLPMYQRGNFARLPARCIVVASNDTSPKAAKTGRKS